MCNNLCNRFTSQRQDNLLLPVRGMQGTSIPTKQVMLTMLIQV
jgi:hypothetical protein